MQREIINVPSGNIIEKLESITDDLYESRGIVIELQHTMNKYSVYIYDEEYPDLYFFIGYDGEEFLRGFMAEAVNIQNDFEKQIGELAQKYFLKIEYDAYSLKLFEEVLKYGLE